MIIILKTYNFKMMVMLIIKDKTYTFIIIITIIMLLEIVFNFKLFKIIN